MNAQELLTPAEAAKFLRVSQDKLRELRSSGTGPAYSRLGHRTVRYEMSNVLAWIQKSCVKPEGAN
jgi:excisionase family DNA binding protein